MHIHKNLLALIFLISGTLNDLFANNVQLEITQQFHKEYIEKTFPYQFLVPHSFTDWTRRKLCTPEKQTITLTSNNQFSASTTKALWNSADINGSLRFFIVNKGSMLGYAEGAAPKISNILLPNKYDLLAACVGILGSFNKSKKLRIKTYTVGYLALKYVYYALLLPLAPPSTEDKYTWIDLNKDPITINTNTQTITIKQLEGPK